MENNTYGNVTSTVKRFIDSGEWGPALELLMAENNQRPNSNLERQLVDLRIRAFRESNWPAPDVTWPPVHGVLPSSGFDLPEIERAELSAKTLRSGILGNGGLIVRGLMDKNTVEEMQQNIDRTLSARHTLIEQSQEFSQRTWYARSPEVEGRTPGFYGQGAESEASTAFAWAVDSPRTASQLVQFYRSINLPGLLRDYFCEPATLSVKKWVLRRVAPENGGESGWHQDGRFLGDGIRSVNLWVPLTECGGDTKAPGMEIVGGSNKTIYETGTHGAPFDWTVGQGLISELGADSPVLCPKFAPGDALFFDHYNLHRTAFGTDHTEVRYALESWFFAASRAPAKQIPVFF